MHAESNKHDKVLCVETEFARDKKKPTPQNRNLPIKTGKILEKTLT